MRREKVLSSKKTGTEITATQKAYLTMIRDHIRTMGYPPTLREMCQALKVNLNAVFEIVCRLERDGYLKMGRLKSRTMVVTEKGWNA
jgi:repressor LexA